MIAFAAAMASLALIAGAVAWLRAEHQRKITLAKWKRRAERTHAYYEALRRISHTTN